MTQASVIMSSALFHFITLLEGWKVSLMYLVYKREALLRISHCFPLLICMTRVAAPSSPTFCTLDLHMRSKWNSVYFLFPVGTAATCIFDYTLYIHEEGKYNPLGKIDEGDFSVLYSIALYSVWLSTQFWLLVLKKSHPTSLCSPIWKLRQSQKINQLPTDKLHKTPPV